MTIHSAKEKEEKKKKKRRRGEDSAKEKKTTRKEEDEEEEGEKARSQQKITLMNTVISRTPLAGIDSWSMFMGSCPLIREAKGGKTGKESGSRK
jgi:hypothetical protein